MNRLRFRTSLATLVAFPILFAACQSPENPASPAPSPAPAPLHSRYYAEAEALKKSMDIDFEAELRRLQVKHGMVAAEDRPWIQPLRKVAARLMVDKEDTIQELHYFVSRWDEGEQISLITSSKMESEELPDVSDPMLYIIQFDDYTFQTRGIVPRNGQAPFRIMAWDDDGGGNRQARLTWTVPANGTGYYMVMAIPASVQTQGKVQIRYTICTDICWNVRRNWGRMMGSIERGQPGNDFRATRDLVDSDPWLFAIRTTARDGVANDNVEPLKYSRIYHPPFFLDGRDFYDFVLVTRNAPPNATVRYRQYIP